MFILNVPIESEVNVSSLSPRKNFSSYNNLFIHNNYNLIYNKILFKIPINLNELITNCKVNSIKLCFKTSNFSGTNITFYISKNMSEYSSTNITWNNCPMSSSTIKIPWTYNLNNKILKLNLTDIITNFSQYNDTNFGFQLLGIGKKINILLSSSRTDIVPYIEIKIKKFSSQDCNDSRKNISYLDAYINNFNKSTIKIDNKQFIPFNSIRLSHDIFLCNDDHSITITKAGIYIVNWQFYLYGTSQINTVKISLKHNKKILSSLYFPTNINDIMGSSIINVSPKEALEGYDLLIYNDSSNEINDNGLGDIYLAPVSIPASITIYSL